MKRISTRQLLLEALLVSLALVVVGAVAARGGAVDYDIVYVRTPRGGDEVNSRWPEAFNPTNVDGDADLMLLRRDAEEPEVLFDAGQFGAVVDPVVSFDARWVYFSYFYDVRWNVQRDMPAAGADIFRIHVETRELQQLTRAGGEADGYLRPGEFTFNTGAGRWWQTPDGAYQHNRVPDGYHYLGFGIFNLGPCPMPGGKVLFTSNRNAYVPPRGYPRITLQLFIMDDDGSNVDQIGYLNIACALHPVILTDGRITYSTLESHGAHNSIL